MLCALAVAGCAAALELDPLPPPPHETPLSVLYLVGDAGDAVPGDPVLRRLAADIRADDAAGRVVTVAFLGDNVYPAGVRPGPEGVADTITLSAQLSVVEGTSAGALFVPGNHDWADAGPGGLVAVETQHAYFDGRAARGARVSSLPAPGCPGPEPLDLPGVRLIVLDTQWFLHAHERGDALRCGAAQADEVARRMVEQIGSAGAREAILIAHHPLRTNGVHGGYFPSSRHLFPLLDAAPWAYLPLPILGSLYVWVRSSGVSAQDLPSDEYREMRRVLEGALARAERPPLAFAAGHEHGLQILEGGSAGVEYHIVSGSAGRTSPIGRGDDTLVGTSEVGYVKVEVTPSEVRMTVLPLDGAAGGDRLGWCTRVDRTTRARRPCA